MLLKFSVIQNPNLVIGKLAKASRKHPFLSATSGFSNDTFHREPFCCEYAALHSLPASKKDKDPSIFCIQAHGGRSPGSHLYQIYFSGSV